MKTKQNTGRKKAESGISHVALPDGSLPSKPQPRDNTKINGYGLVQDVRASQRETRANRPSSDLINKVSVWLFQFWEAENEQAAPTTLQGHIH